MTGLKQWSDEGLGYWFRKTSFSHAILIPDNFYGSGIQTGVNQENYGSDQAR